MGSFCRRILTDGFEQALASGMLEPLLSLVNRDRDLIAEIRKEKLDIYCKGNRLVGITPEGQGYRFQSDVKFWNERTKVFHGAQDVADFSANSVPFIKQRIAEHSAKGKEIEFEQMVIRSCNLEALNTDYIAVDRQGLADGRSGQMDILGVFWPGQKRGHVKTLAPALIEVKYGLTGGVEEVASQIERYYNHIESTLPTFVEELQAQLRQKARLGLLSGLSKDAQRKIQTLPISGLAHDLRIVIALVDYNPHATGLVTAKAALQKLAFRDQIEIYHLGFGMWEQNADFDHASLALDQLLEVRKDCLGTIQSEEGEILFEDMEGVDVAAKNRRFFQQRDLRELASFEPVLARPGFQFATWHLLPLTEAIGSAPYRVHSEDAELFIRAGVALGSPLSFDWSKWLHTTEAQQLCEEPGRIATADHDQLAKLLTCHILNDRTNSGALNAAFESGILMEIVQRAQALLED